MAKRTIQPVKKATKVAVKTAAKKTSKIKYSESDGIDEVGDEEFIAFMEDIDQSLEVLANRRKTKTIDLMSARDFNHEVMLVRSLPMEHMLSAVGMHSQKVTEIIGPEGVGKTTLLYMLAGKFCAQGCMTIMVEAENKSMDPEWAQRIMHPDPKIGRRLYSMVRHIKGRRLVQADENVQALLPVIRDKADSFPATRGKPIIVFYDNWSSLLSEMEADQVNRWGKSKTAETAEDKKKLTGTAGNMGHAKHAHSLKRALPSMMESFNASFFFTKHQNEEVDMSGMPSFFTTPERQNDEAIGGGGIAQVAAYRWTLTRTKQIRNKTTKKLERDVLLLHALKTYRGVRDRGFKFEVVYEQDGEQGDVVVDTAMQFCFWLKDQKLMTITEKDGLFTCKDLDLHALPAGEFEAAIYADADVMLSLRQSLRIKGADRFAPTTTPTVEDEEKGTTTDSDE